MEHVPSQEPGDIPIPISVPPLNTSYIHASAAAGGSHGHAHHHHHQHPTIIPQHPIHNHLLIPHHPQLSSSTVLDDPSPTTQLTTAVGTPLSLPYKKPPVRYRECLKNHAASVGGNAMDGCGEFMPSGEEGTIEALTCSACGCHRNFHRKEVEGEPSMEYLGLASRMGSRKLILAAPHRHHHQIPRNAISGQIIVHPHHQILQSEPDEQEERTPGARMRHQEPRPQQQQQRHHNSHQGQQTGGGKKRYRTKFTLEQKEKMLEFAERAGWKIQKQEEWVVQRFCQEVGVKRRVLKVWMHNNKHNLASKASLGDQPGNGNGNGNSSSPPPPPPPHMSHNPHPSMN